MHERLDDGRTPGAEVEGTEAGCEVPDDAAVRGRGVVVGGVLGGGDELVEEVVLDGGGMVVQGGEGEEEGEGAVVDDVEDCGVGGVGEGVAVDAGWAGEGGR